MDFWKLPGPEGPLPDSDDEAPAPPPAASAGAPAAPAPAAAQAPEAPARGLSWTLDGASGLSMGDPRMAALELSEATVQEHSYPVALGSLGAYLRALRLEASGLEGAALAEERCLSGAELVQCVAAAQLARECGDEPEAVPRELWAAAGAAGAAGPGRRSLRVAGGPELAGCGGAVAEGAAGPSRCGWRALCSGQQGPPPDPALCGALGPLPPLPNPLTVLSDVPALAEQMLSGIPREDWDAKRPLPPRPVEAFPPGLCRGPGGLLPAHTPRQLALNVIAAATLNRLCANVLGVAARCSDEARKAPTRSPEERALEDAEAKAKAAAEARQEAALEETRARAELRAFQRKMEPDADRERELQSVVGWKSSVRIQVDSEVEEASREVRAAKQALAASKQCPRAAPWHEQWPGPVPAEAGSQPPFAVRLSAKGELIHTVRGFVEAMQSGLVDRSGAVRGFVSKHLLEAGFARQAVEGLLLCTRKGDRQEAAEVYTHLPAPATIGCEFAPAGGGEEFRAVRPHHSFVLRLQGQTFPFEVGFGPVGGRGLAFVGIGTRAGSHALPWNPLEYVDVLWATEAQESLGLLPPLAALAVLVTDPEIRLGPFPPVGAPGEVPLGTGGLALLQAALFHDVKMWPVALPGAAKARWEYALRALRRSLLRRREGPSLDGGDEVDIDTVRDEALPRLLAALKKVPSDSPAGAVGSRGLRDRLKRMELSALNQVPLRGAVDFHKHLGDLSELYLQFLEDTGGAEDD